VPYTRVADRGQQSTTNIRTEHGQTSQTGSSRPAVNQATGKFGHSYFPSYICYSEYWKFAYFGNTQVVWLANFGNLGF
jgi:hypothetical protein